MVSLNIDIDSILQRFVTNEFIFLLIEISQEFLHNLLPVKEMLSDLSVEMINSSSLNLWTNALFLDKFAKLLFNSLFDL
jgi:hypothetical protein